MPLRNKSTAEEGAALILQGCIQQIDEGIRAVLTMDDPEGPHRLRIGLRRLRAALSFFSPAIMGPESQRLAKEAKWLGREVGKTRDLDVFRLNIEKAVRDHGEMSADPSELIQDVSTIAKQQRAELRDLLVQDRAETFMSDLRNYTEKRGWLLPSDISQTRRLAQRFDKLAKHSLQRRWKKTSRAASRLTTQSAAERHDLRKELKKLRYSLEFVEPLYSGKQFNRYLEKLKKLQDIFGHLNDAIVARHVVADLENLNGMRPQAIGCEVKEVLKAQELGAERKLEEAAAEWRALEKAKRPWK
jgi:CHAD domain-containing protein